MLKTLHISLLAVVLVLSSCAKTLTREEPLELTLRPVASVSTKADPELDGASLGTDNTYVIYASASATGNPAYLTGQLFTYYSSSTAWKASSGTPGNYESSPVYCLKASATTRYLCFVMSFHKIGLASN